MYCTYTSHAKTTELINLTGTLTSAHPPPKPCRAHKQQYFMRNAATEETGLVVFKDCFFRQLQFSKLQPNFYFLIYRIFFSAGNFWSTIPINENGFNRIGHARSSLLHFSISARNDIEQIVLRSEKGIVEQNK